MSLSKIGLLFLSVVVVVAMSSFGWGLIGVNEPVAYSLPFEEGPYGGFISEAISCLIFGVKVGFWLAVTAVVTAIAIFVLFGVNVAIEIFRKLGSGIGYMASSIKGSEQPTRPPTVTSAEAIKILEARIAKLESERE